jgi:hypothetical protein
VSRRRPSVQPDRGGFTILLVPDQGQRDVRQLHLTRRQLRRAKLGALALGMLGLALLGALLALWPRVSGYDQLVEENIALEQRMRSIDGQLDAIDNALQRIRIYDAHIRNLSEEADLPGFGPMSDEEQDRWDRLMGDEVPEPPTERAELPGLDGQTSPPERDELGTADIRPVELWAQSVETRALQLLGLVDEMEPHMSAMVQDLEDWRSYRSSLPTIWPAQGTFVSGFGYRRSPISRRWVFHHGIDIGSPRGTPIFAVAPGVVIFSGYNAGYGRSIEIDHGNGVITRYAHNTSNYVREGDVIDVGECIGTVGSTGRSTGPHLHFELKIDGQVVDPMDYLP